VKEIILVVCDAVEFIVLCPHSYLLDLPQTGRIDGCKNWWRRKCGSRNLLSRQTRVGKAGREHRGIFWGLGSGRTSSQTFFGEV